MKQKEKVFTAVAIAYTAMNALSIFTYNNFESYSKRYEDLGLECPYKSEAEFYEERNETYSKPAVMLIAPINYFQFKSDYNAFVEKNAKQELENKNSEKLNKVLKQ